MSALAAEGRRVDRDLEPIREKVLAGERLSFEDGLTLYRTRDIFTLGELANLVRERLHGRRAYYIVNRHINYTNYCVLRCKFCSFYRPWGKADDGYELSLDEIEQIAGEAYDRGAREVHIVGGLHPKLPFEYYVEMFRRIRQRCPTIAIKAFTAIEIIHFTRISRPRRSIEQVLTELRDAGLDMLPGGGAEIFDDRVHDEAFRAKVGEKHWFDVHRAAHALGIPTNCTMLYGHIESLEQRVMHLIKLREHQDESLRRRAQGAGRRAQGQGARGTAGGPDEDGDQSPSTGHAKLGGQSPLAGHGGQTPSAGKTPVASGLRARRDARAPAASAGEAHADDPAARGTAHRAVAHTSEPATQQTAAPSHAPRPACFNCCIPLSFIPEGSAFAHLPGPTGLDDLRTLAVARLMLDNIPHVKSFWPMHSPKLAQIALNWGVDDFDGTVVWYDITKREGRGTNRQELTVDQIRRLIREAGCEPVERDAFYNCVGT